MKVLRKCVYEKEKLIPLNLIGVSCKSMLKSLFQTVCYPRKGEESLIETGVKLWKQIKTSQSLPRDENLLLQDTNCIFTIKFLISQE